MVRIVKKTVARVIFFAIHIFKCVFQMPQGSCRFTPTCSEYAREAIEKGPILNALLLIAKRVVRCNPCSRGGYDPVPEHCKVMKG